MPNSTITAVNGLFFPKKLFMAMTLPGFISMNINAQAGVSLTPIGGYETGAVDADAAEIVAHDSVNQQLFFINGDTKTVFDQVVNGVGVHGLVCNLGFKTGPLKNLH